MDTTQKAAIKSSISKCTDVAILSELEQHIVMRKVEIRKAEWESKKTAFWDGIKKAKPGDTLYVTFDGTFVGGPFQRGDSMTLTYIQPRAKRVLVDAKGKTYWFDVVGIAKYELRTTPPESPISASERKIADTVGKVFDRAAA